MRKPPPYYQQIRENAARRWTQLEADPELAAPWWQLFRQVQSPRHVISELMQNAEDAGATWVAARLEGGTFVFEHDGHDFREEEFRSLCRFGFSNKRSLLTIGFRGIGFRSVFSLGPVVQVETRSIACSFEASRFTLPSWEKDAGPIEHTRISCRVTPGKAPELILREIERWTETPIPLLFFTSIQEMRFGGKTVAVERLGDGPFPGATRVRLTGHKSEHLVIRSQADALPEDCLQEIRTERGDPAIELPPIGVAVVQGEKAQGRLHVVLPTDVVIPNLPVAVHAPFIQDPGRVGIKDPATSLTNRWLLGQVGRLLGDSLRYWVGNEALSLSERSRAYHLLPSSDATGAGLAGGAAEVVWGSLKDCISEASVLLCADGMVRGAGEAVALPGSVLRVWTEEQALEVAEASASFAVAEEASIGHAKRLAAWSLCDNVTLDSVMERLARGGVIPGPISTEALVGLWALCGERTSREYWKWQDWWTKARIVPAAGRSTLQSASDTLPAVPSRPPRVTEGDWAWLVARVGAVDDRFAAWARRDKPMASVVEACAAAGAPVSEDNVRTFRRAFQEARLQQAPTELSLVTAAARNLSQQAEVPAADWMTVARIAWRMNLDLGPKGEGDVFRFVCRDGKARRREYLVGLLSAGATDLYPESWLRTNVVSGDYEAGLGPEVLAWRQWLVSSAGARLEPVPLPTAAERTITELAAFARWLKSVGGTLPRERHFQRDCFVVSDWRWNALITQHWEEREASVPGLWQRVATGLLEAAMRDPACLPKEALVAEVQQESQKGTRKPLDVGRPQAGWLALLRSKACLPDEFGAAHAPDQLLRRTPETEALIGIESFVRADLDSHQVAPVLDALGVRSSATSTERILERLLALAGTDVPVGKVRDLYRALERVLLRLSSDDCARFRASISEQAIVRTKQGWHRSSHAFRSNPFELPGVDVLHADVSDLTQLWERVGVRAQPSVEDVVDWLRALPVEVVLPESQRVAVRAALRNAPIQAWSELKLWLNVTGQLIPAESVEWVTREPRTLEGLFPTYRKGTADFSFVESETWEALRGKLPVLLDSKIQSRAEANACLSVEHPEETSWLAKLGGLLTRLKQEGEASILSRDRGEARRMATSRWMAVPELQVVPLVDGMPAGQVRKVKVAWVETRLLAVDGSSRLFQDLIRELGRSFGSDAARSIIRDCAGRSPTWIDAYAREHVPLEEAPAEPMPELAERGGPGGTETAVGPAGSSAALVPGATDGATERDEQASGQPPTTTGPGPGPEPGPAARFERFAEALREMGFEWDRANRVYRGANGCIRPREGPFHWEWVDGEVVRPIWVADRPLDHLQGVEVPHEIWTAGVTLNGLLFEPNDGRFAPHAFSDLHEAVQRQEYELFASRYRLRIRSEQDHDPKTHAHHRAQKGGRR